MRYAEPGFSLIEMLVSLTLVALLLNCLTGIYLTTQNNINNEIQLLDLLENIQTVNEILSRAIKKAGYIGCAKLTADFPILNQTEFALTATNKIEINESNTQITIRNASLNDVPLLQMDNLSSIVVSSAFEVGDIIVISDCHSADIIQINSIETINKTSQRLNFLNPLSKKYDEYASVSVLEVNSFYSAPTSRKDSKGKPIYALYLLDKAQEKKELIEGVNQIAFQIEPAEGKTLVAIKLIMQSITSSPLIKNIYLYVQA